MAETIVLAATTNADESADIVVSGTPVTVFIFATDGKVNSDLQCPIRAKVIATGLYQPVPDEQGQSAYLTRSRLERTFYADGVYQVAKPATEEAIGIGTR